MTIKFYRKKILLFTALILLFLSIVILIDYFADPGNEFSYSKEFEERVSTTLLKNSVLVCSNYDDRSLKKRMIKQLNYHPEVLILGSSRVMPIGNEHFNKMKVFNAAVTQAGLEDDISLYYLYRQQWQEPKMVLIGLDTGILMKNNGWANWKIMFHNDYAAALKILLHRNMAHEYRTYIEGIYYKYMSLLSSSYFKGSLKKIYLLKHMIRDRRPDASVVLHPTSHDWFDYPLCFLQNPDGSRFPPASAERISIDEANAISNMDVRNKNLLKLGKFSPENMNIFEDFIHYLIKNNTQVVFFFPPYEPRMFQAMKRKHSKKMIAINNYFAHIAKKYNIKMIGNYDPRQEQLSSSDFFDSIHLKKEGIDKVFENAFTSIG